MTAAGDGPAVLSGPALVPAGAAVAGALPGPAFVQAGVSGVSW
jgi:hypothetical protein